MVSDARKTDAQRFGNGKKGFSVKQVKDILSEIPTTEEMETALETKQDVLTAGDNITITDNVISASGGTVEVTEPIAIINDKIDLANWTQFTNINDVKTIPNILDTDYIFVIDISRYEPSKFMFYLPKGLDININKFNTVNIYGMIDDAFNNARWASLTIELKKFIGANANSSNIVSAYLIPYITSSDSQYYTFNYSISVNIYISFTNTQSYIDSRSFQVFKRGVIE